ncbi:MAG: N-acetyltransferase family protein [Planctomycetota bacterium]
MIRDATPADAPAIAAVYNHYVERSIATFEEVAVSADEMARRMEPAQGRTPFLVAEDDAAVVGYAYACPFNTRAAYRHTREITVYLHPERTGRGHGTALYRELLDRLKTQGIHAVIGGVSLPNPASVALHEKLGFTKVAEFPEVGRKFDRWIAVGYWQLTGLTD